MWETPPFSALEDAVRSPSNPIGMRMRAAYFLRQAYESASRNGDDGAAEAAIRSLAAGLADRRHGSLLRHEFSYVMGQLRDERCCPALESTLSDSSDCAMVRHECGEALGAIGARRSEPVLEAAIEADPGSPEIGQTCELALAHMRWRMAGGESSEMGNGMEEPAACACMLSPYSSVDPAPPHPGHAGVPTPELGAVLRDASLPLFERYRAMFSLRNRGGEGSVLELGGALVSDESSALLRHEVAYVLGQMQHPASVESLTESLRRADEHRMVRHESAEALGAIEGRWEDCEMVLREFLNDDDEVVRESCIVALDAADYWGHGTQTVVEEGQRKIPVDDNKEEKDGGQALSFVKQKAVTDGKKDITGEGNLDVAAKKEKVSVLNHFNVVS